MNNKNFKIELPRAIGDKITFYVENSPTRHGVIKTFISRNEENSIEIIGYRVRCKNGSRRIVYINEIIEE